MQRRPGPLQERAQRIGHEQVHGIEPRVGQHVRRYHRQVELAEFAPVKRVGLERGRHAQLAPQKDRNATNCRYRYCFGVSNRLYYR